MRELLEHSLQYLEDITDADFGSGREMRSPPVRILSFQVVEHEGLVEFKARVVNTEENSTYDVKIHIHDFNSWDGEKEIAAVNSGFINYHGDEIDENDVQVVCNCKDFYWRFAYWNAENGSLLGPRPKPYTKLTDRPPVNPTKTPGICKHIIAVKRHIEKIL